MTLTLANETYLVIYSTVGDYDYNDDDHDGCSWDLSMTQVFCIFHIFHLLLSIILIVIATTHLICYFCYYLRHYLYYSVHYVMFSFNYATSLPLHLDLRDHSSTTCRVNWLDVMQNHYNIIAPVLIVAVICVLTVQATVVATVK